MADMASFDEQMPCVGIFWYDPEEHNFFGVHKKEITHHPDYPPFVISTKRLLPLSSRLSEAHGEISLFTSDDGERID